MAGVLKRDLTGERFERLTVLSRGADGNGRPRWNCRCECGTAVLVLGQNLMNGNSRSCGCLNRAAASARTSQRNWRHGLRESPEYGVWCAMRDRCNRESDPHYKNWGARGIRVCDRWNESFEAFIADMGRRPSSNHTLERNDNDGNYCLENCRWAPRAEQARNQRKTIRVAGLATAREIAVVAGVSVGTIYQRRYKGWSDDRLLEPDNNKR